MNDSATVERAELVLPTTSALLGKLLQNGTANGRTQSIDQLLASVRDLLIQEAEHRNTLDDNITTDQRALRPAHLLVLALRCAGRCTEKRTAELFRDCLALVAASAAVSLGFRFNCDRHGAETLSAW